MTSRPEPIWMLAIDPGETHTGMALFRVWTDSTGWRGECTAAWESPPDEAIAYTAGALSPNLDHQPKIGILVVEEFRLYEDKMANLAGTQILTIEVIGVLRYLHRAAANLGSGCEWHQQGARIKKGTRQICRAKGITSKSKGSVHAKDAELHGWYHLLNIMDGQPGTWEQPKPKAPARKPAKRPVRAR